MAIPANFLSTVDFGLAAGQNANREDLQDWIVNVDRTDTPLTSSIGTVDATAIQHEWLNETLRHPKTYAGFGAGTSLVTGRDEGMDFAADQLTKPVRKKNYLQIFETFFALTRTQISIARKGGTAGIRSMAGHESRKVMQELLRAFEARCFSTKDADGNDGAGGTVRKMKTLDDATAVSGMLIDNSALGFGSNIVAAGTPTEDQFLLLLSAVAEAGVKVNQIHVSLGWKKRISKTFVGYGTAGAPLNRETSKNTVVATFDYYQTDFGVAKLVGNIWVTKENEIEYPTDTPDTESGRIWFLQTDMIKAAWLDKFQTNLIGKRGDSMAFQVVGEGTLEVRTDRMGKFTGVDNAA